MFRGGGSREPQGTLRTGVWQKQPPEGVWKDTVTNLPGQVEECPLHLAGERQEMESMLRLCGGVSRLVPPTSLVFFHVCPVGGRLSKREIYKRVVVAF